MKRTAQQRITITWLGHSAFALQSPTGKIVLIDPWLDNPKAPPGAREISPVDAILITHGHADHIGNTVEIARRTGAKVYANYEVSRYLTGAGVTTAEGINKSGGVSFAGIRATMVDATHSSGIEAGEQFLAGGDPAGFVVRFENGFTVYHAGDTGVFGDMKIIATLYKPDVVIIPIGGYFTMGPREAALAATFLKPRYIIGMHYGTFPLLAGTPAELRKFLPAPLKKRVLVLEPGLPVQLP